MSPGMVDTDLGRKSMPAWLWYILKPMRFLLLKHADEGETMWMLTILECHDDPPSFLDNDAMILLFPFQLMIPLLFMSMLFFM